MHAQERILSFGRNFLGRFVPCPQEFSLGHEISRNLQNKNGEGEPLGEGGEHNHASIQQQTRPNPFRQAWNALARFCNIVNARAE